MNRYSQLYIERGKPQPDSKRARTRIAAYFADAPGLDTNNNNLAGMVRRELGVQIPTGYDGYVFSRFFADAEIRDVLDTVTFIYLVTRQQGTQKAADGWLVFVERVFREENLAYTVDQTTGVVQPFVDGEFQVNRAATLEALGHPRFGEALRDFEAAYRHLRSGEGKGAIRTMFPAVETAAKVLFPGKLARLMPNEVDGHLVPRLLEKYAGNQPAIGAGRRLLAGMKEWINAAQLYRHGQEQQTLAEPPQDFVVAHLSAGATYLRWMIELCSP